MSGCTLSSRQRSDAGAEKLPNAINPPIDLPIGGVTPFTTIDFPGRMAAVLYTQGCEWRCRYCHNSHLWPFQPQKAGVPFAKVLEFLETRKGLLDGVVFCGGEPTAHEGLVPAMRAVKTLGFEIALHTTGMYPDRLEAALVLCDWVGMDIKAPFGEYEAVTGVAGSGAGPRASLKRLLQSGVDHEVRTTVHPDLLSEDRILEIAEDLQAMGVRRYVLQTFRPDGCLDKKLKEPLMPDRTISKKLRADLERIFPDFRVRS